MLGRITARILKNAPVYPGVFLNVYMLVISLAGVAMGVLLLTGHFSYEYLDPIHRSGAKELGAVWTVACLCMAVVMARSLAIAIRRTRAPSDEKER